MPLFASIGAGSVTSYGLLGRRRVVFPIVSVFQTSTNWTVPPGVSSVEYLIVAGGGGGGKNLGGGGGAGGYRTGTGFGVVSAQTWAIVVSGGGAAGTGGNGGDASNTGIYSRDTPATSLWSTGGGGGGSADTGTPGRNGGSGGGGAGVNNTGGGTGTPGQGNNGGSGGGSGGGGQGAGAGGGGAGEVGQNWQSGILGGRGGNGLYNTISGSNTAYAGGGAGGSDGNLGNAGGVGGGGSSTTAPFKVGNSGNTATGGGGGGGNGTGASAGGAGGSGIIILKYFTEFPYVGIQVVKASLYSVYNGGARACNYNVQWSDDNINWTTSFSGNMFTNACGIFDGSISSLNSLGLHRYWRYVATTPTIDHHPRYARLFVTDTLGRKFNLSVAAGDNCSDIGYIPLMEGTGTLGPLDSLTATPY